MHIPPRSIRPAPESSIRRLALSRIFLVACLCAAAAHPLAAESGTLLGLSNDAEARSNGTVGNQTGGPALVGGVAGVQSCLVNMFQIPSSVLADPAQRFSTATYSVKTSFMAPYPYNCDLYGIGFDASSPAVDPADYYEGALDAGSALIADNFLTGSTPSWMIVSASNSALVDYLNARLDAAREAGAATAYVFFRINPDAYIYWNAYQVGTTEWGGSYIPTLSYTTESVPVWSSVPLGGGGFVTGVVSSPSGDTIYCRTDVGGAFRWSPAGDAEGNGSWVSLSDKMVPFGTSGAGALMCVESIAVDPGVPGRVYVAVGNPNASTTTRGIYRSDDSGTTWSLIDQSNTFVIQGNGSSRANGERLAVDPNNPDILWYGSTTSGLRKFTKSETGWTATQIPSSSVPFGTANTGVSFVVCDKNGANTIVYAGVSDPVAGGVYVSTDGGGTWTKAGGASALSPRRAQIAANGTLYISLGTAGVAKLPRNGTLALLSSLPGGQTYHAIAVDPNDASGQTVYAASSSSTNISRSTDGGATWATQTTTFNDGPLTMTNHARTEPDGTKCLTGYWFGNTAAMMINPANSNELWLGDFFGVNRTRNAQDLGKNPGAWWFTLQKNQEETVVLALKNAAVGAKLLTGLSDVGGFRYLNNTSSRPYGSNGNSMGGDNIPSLDFCESSPDVWARTTVAANHSSGSGGVSLDGGATWTNFGQLAFKSVANDAAGGWESFDVGPYLKQIQAAGASSVTLVVRANSWLVNNGFPQYSSREGNNPPQLVLNGATTLAPVADASVVGYTANTNYGADSVLQASGYYGQVNAERWSFLKFDLGGQAPVTSATLRLYRQPSSDANVFQTTVSATPTNSWIEGNGGSDNLPAGEITWTNKPADLHAVPGALRMGGGRIAVSATDPANFVWMGIKIWPNELPMYFSKNRGVTWTAAQGGPNSNITGIPTNGSSIASSGQPLAADRANGYFYAGAFGGSLHKIYRSADGGASWLQVSTVPNGNSYNMRTPQLVAAPVSPACPAGGDVWLCDDGSYNGLGGGLWRSTDSAGSWFPITGAGKVSQVSFGKSSAPEGYSVFVHGVVNGVKGIHRSDDYGQTWVKLADPGISGIQALAGDRQSHGKMFIGTDGRGTFQSQ